MNIRRNYKLKTRWIVVIVVVSLILPVSALAVWFASIVAKVEAIGPSAMPAGSSRPSFVSELLSASCHKTESGDRTSEKIAGTREFYGTSWVCMVENYCKAGIRDIVSDWSLRPVSKASLPNVFFERTGAVGASECSSNRYFASSSVVESIDEASDENFPEGEYIVVQVCSNGDLVAWYYQAW